MKKKAKAVKKPAKTKPKKGRALPPPPEPELPEIVIVLRRLDERLSQLERKTELILTRLSERLRAASFPQQGQRPEHRSTHSEKPASHPQHSERTGRSLFSAVCADCGSACEVPFKPSADRAVYCKVCYSKRKNGSGPALQTHGAAGGSTPAVTLPKPVPVTTAMGNRLALSEMESEPLKKSVRAKAASKKKGKAAPKKKRPR